MSLNGEERKKHILNILQVKGKVRVSNVADELNVSSETIRRHLEELENENKIKRVYGGAVKISFEGEEPAYDKRVIHYIEEKKKIGQAAAALINDGDVIALDVGTTTQQIITHLRGKKNLTVLTTSVSALNSLIQIHNLGYFTGKIIFIGGEINTKQFTVCGSIAESILEKFYIDKCFIGVGGVSIDHGISGYDPGEVRLSEKIIKNSKQTIILADNSKVGVRNFIEIADLEDIDVIISDVDAPEEWKKN